MAPAQVERVVPPPWNVGCNDIGLEKSRSMGTAADDRLRDDLSSHGRIGRQWHRRRGHARGVCCVFTKHLGIQEVHTESTQVWRTEARARACIAKKKKDDLTRVDPRHPKLCLLALDKRCLS
jgi:hypothetical protein